MNYGLAIVALLAAACGPRTYAECRSECGELGMKSFQPAAIVVRCWCKHSATEAYERREALQ